ncbi:hypothetical protein ACRALDRAFT_2047319 [Sodiomyces alcalophilus JCM 7366]|uniref:uncharacterized protein n=1 Tax=Sodiomyces alcalophilus JCM 7366 TaxID=591952 RepID=UPI0039B3F193
MEAALPFWHHPNMGVSEFQGKSVSLLLAFTFKEAVFVKHGVQKWGFSGTKVCVMS